MAAYLVDGAERLLLHLVVDNKGPVFGGPVGLCAIPYEPEIVGHVVLARRRETPEGPGLLSFGIVAVSVVFLGWSAPPSHGLGGSNGGTPGTRLTHACHRL